MDKNDMEYMGLQFKNVCVLIQELNKKVDRAIEKLDSLEELVVETYNRKETEIKLDAIRDEFEKAIQKTNSYGNLSKPTHKTNGIEYTPGSDILNVPRFATGGISNQHIPFTPDESSDNTNYCNGGCTTEELIRAIEDEISPYIMKRFTEVK